jgi:hypothetical protein
MQIATFDPAISAARTVRHAIDFQEWPGPVRAIAMAQVDFIAVQGFTALHMFAGAFAQAFFH